MALQLTEFAAEIRRDIDAFEAAYRAKAEASPEIYPLTLPAGQEGVVRILSGLPPDRQRLGVMATCQKGRCAK